MPVYGVPFISVFAHTYARPLYTPVAPSGAQNEPGRRLATTGDPPGATVVEAPVDATVVAVVAVATVVAVETVDRPVLEGVVDDVVDGLVEDVVDGAVAGALTGTSDQPRTVVPAH